MLHLYNVAFRLSLMYLGRMRAPPSLFQFQLSAHAYYFSLLLPYYGRPGPVLCSWGSHKFLPLFSFCRAFLSHLQNCQFIVNIVYRRILKSSQIFRRNVANLCRKKPKIYNINDKHMNWFENKLRTVSWGTGGFCVVVHTYTNHHAQTHPRPNTYVRLWHES